MKAPLRLAAIVYRQDLNEGRFVFGATDPQTGTRDFAVIFEFGLPAQADADFWPQAFASLSTMSHGQDFNKELQSLTDLFTKPSEGTRLNQVRSNEQYFGQGWEMREFRVNAAGTALVIGTVKQTPDVSLNAGSGNAKLIEWVKGHGAEIKSGNYELPVELRSGSGFLEDDHFKWLKNGEQQGIEPAVRTAFAMNTCSGCHGRETETRFLHIAPRLAIEPAKLSKFLVDELKVRKSTLTKTVCAAP